MSTPLMLHVVVDDKGNPVLKDMQSNITKLNKKTKGLGITMTKVFKGIVMYQALAKFKQSVAFASKEVFEFNKIFKQTEGITGTSGAALDRLKQKVLNVSNATEHTATNLATATLNISKMGFTIEQSLAVIPHVSNLATSSVGDLDEITQLAVQTMKSFQLQATDMEHIVNVIQGTVSKTAIGVQDFGESMKFIAPIAKTMNVDLEQTAAMIGVLGDIGIKGSLGGTTLKNMFLNIMKPSEKVRKILEGLNSEGLTFNKILKAMDESGVGVKDFLETFNKRAVAGSLALSQLWEKTDKLEEILRMDGVKAADVAGVIRKAWIPQMEILRNSFINTFVVMGEILDRSDIGLGINGITQEFIRLQEWLQANPEQLVNFAREFASVVRVISGNLAKGFTLFFRNLGLIKATLKIIIAANLYKMFSGWALGLGAAVKSLVAFRLAALSLNSVVPVIGLVTVGIYGMIQALKLYKEHQDKMQSDAFNASFGREEKQILNQMRVLQDVKRVWKGYYDLIRTNEAKLASNKPWSNVEVENMRKTIINAKQMIQAAPAASAVVNKMDLSFFNNIKTISDLDKKYMGLRIRLQGVVKSTSELEKINKSAKFEMPDISKDEPGGKGTGGAKKQWWEEQFDYLEASARLAESIAKSLKVGIPSQIVMSAFAGQLQGAGVIPQVTPVGSKLGMGTGGFGDKSFVESALSSGASSYGQQISLMPDYGDMLASKIDYDIKSYESTLEWNEKKKKLGIDLIKDNEAMLDESAIKYIQSEQAKFEANKIAMEELKQYRWEQFDTYLEAASMQVDMIQMIQDAGLEKSRERMQRETDLFEESAKRRLKVVEGNAFKTAIVEKQVARDRKKLADEQAKLEKEQLNKRRIWSMIEIGINTAVGVSGSLRQGGPASFVMAGITAAWGLAQLALVSQQDSYKKGGFTGFGYDSESAGTVHRNEYVINADRTRSLGGPEGVEDMIENSINSTLGTRGSRVAVYVENVIGEEEWVDDLAVRINRSIQRYVN